MPLDFASDFAPDFAPAPQVCRNGSVGFHKGLSAEEQVAAHYGRGGYELLHQRWRGRAGEVDLILGCNGEFVFVEVKASSTHAKAAARVSPRQATRISLAAEEFIGRLPTGRLTPMRIDVATVNGIGEIDIIENALM